MAFVLAVLKLGVEMVGHTKPYELWGTTKTAGSTRRLGTYSVLPRLQTAWQKYVGVATRLDAFHLVGDQKININDQMPKVDRPLSEFTTAEARDSGIIKDAAYFTAVRFLGVGKYERHERDSLEEIMTLAEGLSKENKANYMIYAVNARGYQAFVKNLIGR